MIHLSSKQGSFALSILDYQFEPEGSSTTRDNWLKVALRYRDNDGEWESMIPCLLTWELREIGEWFRDLAKDRTMISIMQFVEPNIKIIKIDDTDDIITLRFWFDFELRPPDNTELKLYQIDVPLTRIQLSQVSENILRECDKFPTR